jgi:hypothetical protein
LALGAAGAHDLGKDQTGGFAIDDHLAEAFGVDLGFGEGLLEGAAAGGLVA